jgi:hypothetical protein
MGRRSFDFSDIARVTLGILLTCREKFDDFDQWEAGIAAPLLALSLGEATDASVPRKPDDEKFSSLRVVPIDGWYIVAYEL